MTNPVISLDQQIEYSRTQVRDCLKRLQQVIADERLAPDVKKSRLEVIEFSLHAQMATTQSLEKLSKISVPEVNDFISGVTSESAYQRVRWAAEHDAGKTNADWFWLIGYLTGKALNAFSAGYIQDGKHHLISSAAALANWHLAVSGVNNEMRPSIALPTGVEP